MDKNIDKNTTSHLCIGTYAHYVLYYVTADDGLKDTNGTTFALPFSSKWLRCPGEKDKKYSVSMYPTEQEGKEAKEKKVKYVL